MTDIIERIGAVVGPTGLLVGDEVKSRPAHIGRADGCAAKAIVRPKSTDEVSQILRLCHAARQPVVPLGGNTGLARGGVAGPDEIVLSLERMTKIEDLDPIGRTLTVEAGAPLQKVHEAAEVAGFTFPLDLGARGSATIGGNIATNAGGYRVLRYGMMRELILGLEAVLADGTVVSSLNKVLKNNTGYDLKQLFIGSEGTLGIVTRAVLRLRARPISECTALVATNAFESVIELFSVVDAGFGGTLSAFEVMWDEFYRLSTGGGEGRAAPLAPGYPYYVLIEALGGDPERDQERFERILGRALEDELIVDATIAQSHGDRQAIWNTRDNVGGLLKWWPIIPFDISLPIQTIESFVAEARAALTQRWPEARSAVVGHLGDSNIHFVVSVDSAEATVRHDVEETVYREVAKRQGSISAEHGIGLEKRDFLSYSRNANEIALMRTLKSALDPLGILNPGKVLA